MWWCSLAGMYGCADARTRHTDDFTSRPVSAYWTISVTPQTCLDEKVHLLAAGIINTLTDFLVFLLPLPTVLQLKIPRRQQIILTCIFGAGLVVCLAGTVRIWYTWKATTTFDRTWESYGVWISSMLELYIGIVSYLGTHSLRIKANTFVPPRSVQQSQHASLFSPATYQVLLAPTLAKVGTSKKSFLLATLSLHTGTNAHRQIPFIPAAILVSATNLPPPSLSRENSKQQSSQQGQ